MPKQKTIQELDTEIAAKERQGSVKYFSQNGLQALA